MALIFPDDDEQQRINEYLQEAGIRWGIPTGGALKFTPLHELQKQRQEYFDECNSKMDQIRRMMGWD